MQTKKQSIVEAVVNTVIAYTISVITQVLVFPLYGVQISLLANMELVAIFTIISFIRNYIIRRYFNKKHSILPPLGPNEPCGPYGEAILKRQQEERENAPEKT